ncbi:hypothetical protein F5B18DRAFT_655197 [Nemania serpens]|nr:hypothetical protein F5B18DRAFT_655197 [Nemania serpens]
MPFLASSTVPSSSSSQSSAPTSGSEPDIDSPLPEQSQTGGSSSSPTGAGVNTGAGTTREKTEAEIEADRLYEEAMEEEYAKREGGRRALSRVVLGIKSRLLPTLSFAHHEIPNHLAIHAMNLVRAKAHRFE